MTLSRQRQTGDAIIEAFNRMDVPAILAPLSPSFVRHIYPKTMGHSSQDLAQYTKEMHSVRTIFTKFTLLVHDVIEDLPARKLCYRLSTDAESLAGPYNNEYMWVFVFDETGDKIIEKTEFTDSKFGMEFSPKLRAAIQQLKEQKELSSPNQ